MKRVPARAVIAFAVLLASCADSTVALGPPQATAPPQPEAASGYSAKPGWTNATFAVAAANPLAADAGLRMLKAGGSAVDAAIAVQMVLALVEPQSSGIGGGAFLLHADGRSHVVEAFDGRETAPAAADENLFLGADGTPMPFAAAVVGGRSVGAPGTVAMLALAHARHGRLPWARLFEPAIGLADHGFAVGARLNTLLRDEKYLKGDATAAGYFYQPGGAPVAVGSTLRNPALADVLRQIALQGPAALQAGPIAEAIVGKVWGHPGNPGRLALGDLAGYQAKVRAPLCFDYSALGRDYAVCGMPRRARAPSPSGRFWGS